MYRALEDIGDYKKGDVVPSEKAEVWLKMYLKPPIVFVVDEPVHVDVPVVKKVERKEEKILPTLFKKKR